MKKPKNKVQEEELEITPEILFSRIKELEGFIQKGKAVQEDITELLDLYTVILK